MTTLWLCEQLETVCLLSPIGHSYQTQLVTVKHGQPTAKPYGTSQQHGPKALKPTSPIHHENAGDTDGSICRRMDMDLDMTFNPSKALIALVALICMTVLIAVGAIEQDQGLPIITMIVGYSVGNGMAALSNKQVEPIIKKKNQ